MLDLEEVGDRGLDLLYILSALICDVWVRELSRGEAMMGVSRNDRLVI